MSIDLTNLNEGQRQAVLQTDGPLMVLAGAGSGKTRTLVCRIVHLLEDKKISPFELLALTFSNKAAREMKERVASMVEEDIGALQITTFHAFCAKLLRFEATYLGIGRNFTIYDMSESKAIAKGILNRRGISQKETSPNEIIYYIDDLKNQGHYFGRNKKEIQVDTSDVFYNYYLEYEDELHRANALDFGGLITAVLQLFEKFPEILNRYQKRFRYLLIDEYQDTNRAQFDLICFLSQQNKNICVVGDEDQSIYSWRGADIRNILDFEKKFTDTQIVKLEQNYRSSKNIIEAASSVISLNTMRKGKTLWTENNEGDSIDIWECGDDKKEAIEIVKDIKKHSKNNIAYNDMAIFYRMNTQSRVIEDALLRASVPYRIIAGMKFYERKEIKDILAYIRLIVNDKDSLAFGRVINIPTRGIGATSVRKFEQEAITRQVSLFELCDLICSNPIEYKHLRLSAKVKSSLGEFSNIINEARVLMAQKEIPSVIYKKVLHESGYYEFIRSMKDYESQARLENLDELGNAIVQYEESEQSPSLLGFLETITLDTNQKDIGNQGEVSLMTIHGAKGLEFPYVYLAGAEEKVFPSIRSIDEGEHGLEEERRLFYVAMTRAMNKLVITFAQGRLLYGSLQFNGPSRFIYEIPNKYYRWIKLSSEESSQLSDKWNDMDQSTLNEEKIYSIERIKKKATYLKGSSIIHALYGEGKVLECQGIGPNEKVIIRFKDGEKKKFLVKFAPLTTL